MQSGYIVLLNSIKAFDTVRHYGFLLKLYDIGIKGKWWRLFRLLYTDMLSCVLCNNVMSSWFPMKRGIRQGSALSAKLYLVFINDLLNELEYSGMGASIMDLRVNAPTQADDICLVTVKRNELSKMINICEITAKNGDLNFRQARVEYKHLNPGIGMIKLQWTPPFTDTVVLCWTKLSTLELIYVKKTLLFILQPKSAKS